MKTDDLKICPCGQSDGCYEQEGEVKTQMCYGCGFMSNSLMKEGEEFYKEQFETLPELYKELIWEDKDGQKWMPTMINIPEQGIIYAELTPEGWKWSASLAVQVKEEEKHKYPIKGKPGEFHKWRTDSSTTKHFDKFDFVEAMDYIGSFK